MTLNTFATGSGPALPVAEGRAVLLCSPRALGAGLGATVLEGHKTIREHPKEDNKDGLEGEMYEER